MPSILITGVSSGLGHALAVKAHAEGWRVFGTVRDNQHPETYDLPAEVTLYRLDLRFSRALEALAGRFMAENGLPPDVLVNNAGYTMYSPVEESDPQATRDIFQVNTFAPVELTRAFLPAMRTRGSGTIVNVTSLGGRIVFPFFTTYNASKHALEGFSEGLWHELKPFGIRVKAVEPGYVDTPIYRAMEERAEPTGPYAPFLTAMNAFSRGVTDRTSPADAAGEVWVAITDSSDRLRYPVAAYARPLLAARRLLGDRRVMRFMHRRWMGRDSG
ncbi:MAG: SDR family oxidoreductase [Coriobacteriia bacterium]|nr:SDR family oxidoreductase [Coriobacteriia bacterium]